MKLHSSVLLLLLGSSAAWAEVVPVEGLKDVFIEEPPVRRDMVGFVLLRRDMPAKAVEALKMLSKRFGLPEYATGLRRPLVIRLGNVRGVAHGGHVEREYIPGRGDGFVLYLDDEIGWSRCRNRAMIYNVLTHEMSHAILQDYLRDGPNDRPAQWLDEGLASHLEGEPTHTIHRDTNYRHFGKAYPGNTPCRLNLSGLATVPMGEMWKCYPYFSLAVEYLLSASPDALPILISELGSGRSIQDAIMKIRGQDSVAFELAATDYASQIHKNMPFYRKYLGTRQWRNYWYCRD